MKKTILTISALTILLSASFVFASGGYVLDIFKVADGIISPSNTSNDFVIPGSSGELTTSEATLYADVSAAKVYMQNADIGSITLNSEVISPFRIGYDGLATSTEMTVGKDGLFTISSTSTSNQLVITEAGNVGIGTSNPSFSFTNAAGLEISTAKANLHLNSTIGANEAILSFGSGGVTKWHIEKDDGDDFSWVESGVARRLRLKSGTGNFQLVTDSQAIELGASQDYSIEWDGSDALHTISAGDFVFTGGNLGIATTTPAAKLDVDGIIRTRPASSRTCDSSVKGGIMYDSDDNNFYGCNGSTWLQLNN